jgi:hypothetical protein
MTSRSAVVALGLVLPFCALPLCAAPPSTVPTNASQCVQCHANLKKLIRLCWKVVEIRPRGKVSTETSGEG